MSGIKPMALTEFYRSLHGRGKTTKILAAEMGVGESTIRKLISGHAARSGITWRFLLAELTDSEKELLQSMEQSSTWNGRAAAAIL